MAYDAGVAAVNRETSFATRDGRVLSGSLFAPHDPAAVMVINPATGYAARFYHAFAQAAASHGWAVLTYDYRGQGASADRPVKDDPARMIDWALEDIPAAARHVCELYPGRPLDVIGHSVGGQFAAFVPQDLPVRRLALLSSSGGYWGRQSAPLKYAAWMFWRVIGPALIAMRGHIPRGALWKGEPLPAGVWKDWRDFGVNPACFRDRLAERGLDGRYARFTAPIKAWTADDDPIATCDAVRWLLERYENAPSEMKIVRHDDLGRGRLGHDGLFRRKTADVFWPQVFRCLALEDHKAAAE